MVTRDKAGMRDCSGSSRFRAACRATSRPETPGSIHEGGELGYSLAHAYGAAFDNPDLLVACVIGDGEAETGPLAASWQSNKFLNPVRDGAVLPILHLNGYKIAGPTVLARIPREELEACSRAMATSRISSKATTRRDASRMAATLDRVLADIRTIQQTRAASGFRARPRWPMIVLRLAQGLDRAERASTASRSRARSAPTRCRSARCTSIPSMSRMLERWMKRYRPRELFDADGRLRPELAALAPTGDRRMGANPQANGGRLLVDLQLPDYRDYAVAVPAPGRGRGRSDARAGRLHPRRHGAQSGHAISASSVRTRSTSNRWNAVFDVTDRCSMAEILAEDDHVAPDGRVMEVLQRAHVRRLARRLSAHRAARLLLMLRGVHPHRRLDVQPACEMAEGVARNPVAAPDRLAQLSCCPRTSGTRTTTASATRIRASSTTSSTRKPRSIRVYLPPDANTLLTVTDTLPAQPRIYVNVVIAGKQPSLQWLSMDAAIRALHAGIGVWEWASNDGGAEPDVVMACCGDVPTLETLAAVSCCASTCPRSVCVSSMSST